MIPKVPRWLVPTTILRNTFGDGARAGLLPSLFTSYASSIARVLSWAIAASIVYRYQGADELAVLMLLRGTVGLLAYVSLGFTPGLVHALSRPVAAIPINRPAGAGINYQPRATSPDQPTPDTIFATSLIVVLIISGLAAVAAWGYANHLNWFHQINSLVIYDAYSIACALSLGVIIRSISEIAGAKLQALGHLTIDNICLILGELIFIIYIVILRDHGATMVASGFVYGSIAILALRFLVLGYHSKINLLKVDFRIIGYLLAMGAWVMLSQISDWLYAPFNQVLIDRFLDTSVVARYVPAIQIDGALLLLVAGIAATMLPRAAWMFHDERSAELRRSYIRGTALSLVLLIVGASVVCLISDWLFRKWFGNPLTATQAILPWVMIHTVIGGSASVGRSVLFGMGRMKPYAMASIVGGISNAVLALIVVTSTRWGLMGIIGVTIFTVFIRCAVWLPWYTLRAIRQEQDCTPLIPSSLAPPA